jgi:hypothetical protein
LIDGGGWKLSVILFKIFLVPGNIEMESKENDGTQSDK